MALVSVIIPTHNRAHYALPTIRSVLALSEEIEVVVCDTSPVDALSAALQHEASTGRLRLVRPGRPMSVVDNFNEALQAATGRYLAFIGDDDFVSREIVEVAKWAAREGVDAIKFSFPVLYFWPDFRHRSRGDLIAGTLQVEPYDGSISRHDAKAAISEALDNFGGGVMEMPRAYAGMIAAGLAKKIEAKHGRLFGGVSPDIYSALLISLEAENCVRIDYPVVVPGASGGSTAGQSANGGHVGGLRDNAHIGAFPDLVWDDRIPEFYSVPTVWSFSLLKAVEKSGMDLREVNFARLYLKCLLYQRAHWRYTVRSLKRYAAVHGVARTAAGLAVGLVHESSWVFDKIWGRIRARIRPAAAPKAHVGLPSTVEASLQIERVHADDGCGVRYPQRAPV